MNLSDLLEMCFIVQFLVQHCMMEEYFMKCGSTEVMFSLKFLMMSAFFLSLVVKSNPYYCSKMKFSELVIAKIEG